MYSSCLQLHCFVLLSSCHTMIHTLVKLGKITPEHIPARQHWHSQGGAVSLYIDLRLLLLKLPRDASRIVLRTITCHRYLRVQSSSDDFFLTTDRPSVSGVFYLTAIHHIEPSALFIVLLKFTRGITTADESKKSTALCALPRISGVKAGKETNHLQDRHSDQGRHATLRNLPDPWTSNSIDPAARINLCSWRYCHHQPLLIINAL